MVIAREQLVRRGGSRVPASSFPLLPHFHRHGATGRRDAVEWIDPKTCGPSPGTGKAIVLSKQSTRLRRHVKLNTGSYGLFQNWLSSHYKRMLDPDMAGWKRGVSKSEADGLYMKYRRDRLNAGLFGFEFQSNHRTNYYRTRWTELKEASKMFNEEFLFSEDSYNRSVDGTIIHRTHDQRVAVEAPLRKDLAKHFNRKLKEFADVMFAAVVSQIHQVLATPIIDVVHSTVFPINEDESLSGYLKKVFREVGEARIKKAGMNKKVGLMGACHWLQINIFTDSTLDILRKVGYSPRFKPDRRGKSFRQGIQHRIANQESGRSPELCPDTGRIREEVHAQFCSRKRAQRGIQIELLGSEKA